jgi:hypothetical protein
MNSTGRHHAARLRHLAAAVISTQRARRGPSMKRVRPQ